MDIVIVPTGKSGKGHFEEMMSMDYDGYSYEMEEEASIFLKDSVCIQRAVVNRNGEPDLSYVITEVRMPFLYDYCVRYVMDDFCGSKEDQRLGYHFEECDASLWGARKVYQYWGGEYPMHKYLVCYNEHYVIITFDWEPTEEQIKIAGEKLSLEKVTTGEN